MTPFQSKRQSAMAQDSFHAMSECVASLGFTLTKDDTKGYWLKSDNRQWYVKYADDVIPLAAYLDR